MSRSTSCGGSCKRPQHPIANHTRPIQVSPQPANDLPSEVPQCVLAPLLLEKHLLDRLSRFEQPPVFDLPVEFAKGALFLPEEVDSGDKRPLLVKDVVLQVRAGSPSWCSRTRLADSPALSLRGSSSSTARRACRMPGQRVIRVS